MLRSSTYSLCSESRATPIEWQCDSLNPGSTIKLRITFPDGKISDQFLSVDSKGLLKLAYPLATPGRYAVEVFDKSGQLIVHGSLGYFR